MAIKKRRQGLTLIELLVVIAVIAVLAALAFPGYRIAIDHAHCSTCASNMHGLSLAFMSYAFDNDGLLPSRVVTGDKWPTLLMPYVGNNPNIYVDPGDPVARQIPVNQLVSNTANNSSFIFNGFNDLGAHENPNLTVNLYTIISLSNLILLGQQVPGGDNFYLDVNDGDQTSVLEKQAYFGGSNYAFADGSMRYLKSGDYSDSMWLVNPNYVIPSP